MMVVRKVVWMLELMVVLKVLLKLACYPVDCLVRSRDSYFYCLVVCLMKAVY